MYDSPETFAGPGGDRPPLDDLEAYLATAAVRRSWVATTGFVLAVVLLAPWVPFAFRAFLGVPGLAVGAVVGFIGGLLAAACGIIGIIRTRRTRRPRRKGRVLAIVATPLGVLCGLVQLAIGLTSYGLISVKTHGDLAVELFRSPSGDVAERAREWHEELASARFQAAVKPEELAGWLSEVLAQHGQLQSATANPKQMFGGERGATVYRMSGQFVNGTVPIEMVVGFEETTKPRIDDVRVAGSSPRDWSAPEAE
jgi:hypothetical protein